MVILIGGSSHVGKTLFSQMLLKKYLIPTLSLDHLKMGLIRAGMTHLTPEDDDEMRAFLWPMAAEIIKTAIENRQDLIVEGCYIPGNWADSFEASYLKEIRPVFIVMSEGYIRAHFGRIQRFACVAEFRKDDRPDRERLVRCSAFYRQEALRYGTPLLSIEDGFAPETLFGELEQILGLSHGSPR